MAALLSLKSYDSDSAGSTSENDEKIDGFNAHLEPLDKSNSIAASMMLVSAPTVESTVRNELYL